MAALDPVWRSPSPSASLAGVPSHTGLHSRIHACTPRTHAHAQISRFSTSHACMVLFGSSFMKVQHTNPAASIERIRHSFEDGARTHVLGMGIPVDVVVQGTLRVKRSVESARVMR